MTRKDMLNKVQKLVAGVKTEMERTENLATWYEDNDMQYQHGIKKRSYLAKKDYFQKMSAFASNLSDDNTSLEYTARFMHEVEKELLFYARSIAEEYAGIKSKSDLRQILVKEHQEMAEQACKLTTEILELYEAGSITLAASKPAKKRM